ncbi:hypothetical protein LSTR_LSTR000368 [Laodelphax striatellus]|uniref:Ammonium transporter n=1 Tax=Laodelphax striatellus TaxID=195883 RepID=A0A482X3P2_LAOST|nr:hypothetical protein LSTR_LSTR000368 [Laodelphax striatellus]
MLNATNETALQDQIEDLKKNVDDVFLLINGIIVSFMQAGFACLEAGCVRSKNVTNILMKNLLDLFIAALVYWLIGYSLAYSKGTAYFGTAHWAGYGLHDDVMAHWFFQMIFAATAATIITGAVAERCNYSAYIIYCAAFSGFVYPVASHWAWTDEGVLAQLGYRDFAGCGVVHALAGVASFFGALFIGPRTGRFSDAKVNEISGHSTMLTGLGGLLLISGFLAFNGGSLGHMSHPNDSQIISRVISNTILGGSGAGIVALILCRTGIVGSPVWSFSYTLNGILAGMVSVCGSADTFSPLGAILSGVCACLIFFSIRRLMYALKVDDPLDAVAVHLGGGFWGALSGPIFARGGLVYSFTKATRAQLANNLFGVLVLCAWSALTSILLFGFMKSVGIFRVSEDDELRGLDIALHGEPAYPSEAWTGIEAGPEVIKIQDLHPAEKSKSKSSKSSYTLRQMNFDNMALDMNSEHRR